MVELKRAVEIKNEYEALKEKRTIMQFAHRLGCIGLPVELQWGGITQANSLPDRVQITVDAQPQQMLIDYSNERKLSLDQFKNNVEILYRTLVAINKRMEALANEGRVEIGAMFNIEVSMFHYIPLMEAYHARKV